MKYKLYIKPNSFRKTKREFKVSKEQIYFILRLSELRCSRMLILLLRLLHEEYPYCWANKCTPWVVLYRLCNKMVHFPLQIDLYSKNLQEKVKYIIQ